MKTSKGAAAFAILAVLLSAAAARAAQPDAGNLGARFRYLSTHGNSSCVVAFMQSIATIA